MQIETVSIPGSDPDDAVIGFCKPGKVQVIPARFEYSDTFDRARVLLGRLIFYLACRRALDLLGRNRRMFMCLLIFFCFFVIFKNKFATAAYRAAVPR